MPITKRICPRIFGFFRDYAFKKCAYDENILNEFPVSLCFRCPFVVPTSTWPAVTDDGQVADDAKGPDDGHVS